MHHIFHSFRDCHGFIKRLYTGDTHCNHTPIGGRGVHKVQRQQGRPRPWGLHIMGHHSMLLTSCSNSASRCLSWWHYFLRPIFPWWNPSYGKSPILPDKKGVPYKPIQCLPYKRSNIHEEARAGRHGVVHLKSHLGLGHQHHMPPTGDPT